MAGPPSRAPAGPGRALAEPALFGDSDSRGQYGYRLITGAYTTSLWRMTFGLAPRIEWDARIKGRGVVGVGEAETLIHAAQLTWMPAEERRRYALTGPPPPDWFTQMQPAPWINGNVISEGRKLAGVSLVDVPAGTVPLGQRIWVLAQTRRTVPPDVPPPDTPARPPDVIRPGRPAGRHRAAVVHDEPVRSTGQHHAAAPAVDMVTAPGEDMITGIAAAARYLGYDKPDSFRRARTRHPIPGEGKTDDGRPCWSPQVLRSWQSTRKIAGNRADAGGPD